jgi:hypothetical protein
MLTIALFCRIALLLDRTCRYFFLARDLSIFFFSLLNPWGLHVRSQLIISLGDWAFLGRALPETQSWLALVGILGGAAGYVMTDKVL